MKPLINLISRVFLALALCVSVPIYARDIPGIPVATVETFGFEGRDAHEKILARLKELHSEGRGDQIFVTFMDKEEQVLRAGTPHEWTVTRYDTTTYLHYFASAGNGEAVDWLLDKGMSENAIDARLDKDGKVMGNSVRTPLDEAYDALYSEVLEILYADEFKRDVLDSGDCASINALKRYGAKTYEELQGGEAQYNPCSAVSIADLCDNPERVDSTGYDKTGYYIPACLEYRDCEDFDLSHLTPYSEDYFDACHALLNPEPKADYTGLYANAAFAIAGTFAPSWVDTQTFAFNAGDRFITGQSLSIPLNDFTFAATRVQVNNEAANYEFGVKWDWEF